MTPFDTVVAFTLREEGGFTDDPRDPGGATNLGITLATLTHWRGRAATADDVRHLTVAEADAIYQAIYWHAMGCDLLPIGIALTVFDFGVNAGPGTSVRELQASIGVTVDGVVGPVTALAAKGADGAGLIGALRGAHEQHYRGLGDFPVFGRGWLARLTRCTVLALLHVHVDPGVVKDITLYAPMVTGVLSILLADATTRKPPGAVAQDVLAALPAVQRAPATSPAAPRPPFV